jgi:hypothetical protein
MSEKNLNDELAAVEAALGSVGPGPSRLDRDRVMFLAGRASLAKPPVGRAHRNRRWAWPAAFSAMTAVAATLLVILVAQEPQPRIVQVIQPPPTPDSDDATGPHERDAPDAPAVSKKPVPATIWARPATVDRDRTPPLPPTPYGRQLRMVLVQAFDGGSGPWPTRRRKHLPRPVTYHELRQRVFEEAAPDAVFPARPPRDLLFPRGADS